MRQRLLVGLLATTLVSAAALAQEGGASPHVMTTGADIKWGAPPPVFEQNAKFAVISGDPSKPGLYVVRLRMPAGYKIQAHWHPTDEHVTVLSGSFALGMGDKFDKAKLKNLPVGGYGLLPANMHHFAMATTAATIQVHGVGPFQLTYVNPADDPSTRAKPK